MNTPIKHEKSASKLKQQAKRHWNTVTVALFIAAYLLSLVVIAVKGI